MSESAGTQGTCEGGIRKRQPLPIALRHASTPLDSGTSHDRAASGCSPVTADSSYWAVIVPQMVFIASGLTLTTAPSTEAILGSPHVFALLVARSCRFGENAQIRVPSGNLVEVYAMYPLTFDEWLRHENRQLDVASLSEVIVQWQTMLR